MVDWNQLQEARPDQLFSCSQVLLTLESSRAICDCMAALVQGDLGAKHSSDLSHADNLLPLSPSGRV